MSDLRRRCASELLGSALLVATVVGSGIMAEQLTGDTALALLANSIATGAILVVLIVVLAPVSGAHLNPAVTLVTVLRRETRPADGAAMAVAQACGGIAGTLLAHTMFGLPLAAASLHERSGPSQWLSEGIATFGLLLVILGGRRAGTATLAWLVGLYIVGAYWFTASTSFANPAVTVARALTDTFAGIRSQDVPGFLAAQFVGALVAAAVARWLYAERAGEPTTPLVPPNNSMPH